MTFIIDIQRTFPELMDLYKLMNATTTIGEKTKVLAMVISRALLSVPSSLRVESRWEYDTPNLVFCPWEWNDAMDTLKALLISDLLPESLKSLFRWRYERTDLPQEINSSFYFDNIFALQNGIELNALQCFKENTFTEDSTMVKVTTTEFPPFLVIDGSGLVRGFGKEQSYKGGRSSFKLSDILIWAGKTYHLEGWVIFRGGHYIYCKYPDRIPENNKVKSYNDMEVKNYNNNVNKNIVSYLKSEKEDVNKGWYQICYAVYVLRSTRK